jgi:DNA-binding response OmpR family regulator
MIAGEVPSPRVLLIDDDDLVLAVLHTALVRAGYSVRDALSSAEARRMLAIQPVDIIVLDAHIPGSTLEGDLAIVAAAHPRPAVIVLSGSSVDPALLEAAGATYLAKPVDASVFLEHVAAANGAR